MRHRFFTVFGFYWCSAKTPLAECRRRENDLVKSVETKNVKRETTAEHMFRHMSRTHTFVGTFVVLAVVQTIKRHARSCESVRTCRTSEKKNTLGREAQRRESKFDFGHFDPDEGSFAVFLYSSLGYRFLRGRVRVRVRVSGLAFRARALRRIYCAAMEIKYKFETVMIVSGLFMLLTMYQLPVASFFKVILCYPLHCWQFYLSCET